MSFKPAIALTAALTLAAGQALAAAPSAVLASSEGDVVVVGAKAQAGAALKAGDRVVVRKGSASLRFADGCTVKVAPGAMATVGAKSPCAGGAGVVSARPADPAQWYKLNGPWDAGAILAATGSVLLVGGVIYGITDPTKCDGVEASDGSCTVSP